MKFNTLLIDLDGTLLGAHSMRLNFYFTFFFIKNLRPYGLSVFKAAKVLHMLKLSMREKSHQKNGITNWNKSINFFSQLSGKSVEESKQILTKTAMICFKKSRPTLFAQKDAIDFVAWAKQHYRLVLATNPLWPLDVVLYRLSIAEIAGENFEFITHSEIMSSSKPHVEYYEELQTMKNLDPKSCLMIGNDEKKDGPARNIGIEVFIIEKSSDFIKLRHKLEADLAQK